MIKCIYISSMVLAFRFASFVLYLVDFLFVVSILLFRFADPLLLFGFFYLSCFNLRVMYTGLMPKPVPNEAVRVRTSREESSLSTLLNSRLLRGKGVGL